MCNAMEIEMPVAGDVNASMTAQTDLKENVGNRAVALGHRSSQPLNGTDFFVPLSQREKPAKKLGDEAGKPPNPTAVEDAPKKRRGRPRKNSLEDDGREVSIPLSAKDRPKKSSVVDAIGAPNSVKLTVAEDGAEKGEKPKTKAEDYGSDFFVPLSKKEKLNKELFKEEAITLKETSSGGEDAVKKRTRPRKSSLDSEGNTVQGSPLGEADDSSKPKRGRPRKILVDDVQEMGKQKQGRSRKKALEDEGNLEDIPKQSESLEDAVTSAGQLPCESEVSVRVVAEQKESSPEVLFDAQAAGTSLRQNDVGNQGQKTQDNEGKQVSHDAVLGDLPLSQVTSCDDFFIPVSKRRKRKEELIDKKSDEAGHAPSKPKTRKNGQAEKCAAEGVTMLHTVLGKEKKSLPRGGLPKESASSLPGSAVPCSEHDLRLEAVLAAEENARLNAGKTTHPFFARKKVSSLKTTIPSEEASSCQVEDPQPGAPMHVTQLSEDERTEVVWSDWKVIPTSVNADKKAELCKIERKRCRLGHHFDQRHAFLTDVSGLSASCTVNPEEMNSDGDESSSTLKALQDLLQHMQNLKSTTAAVGDIAQAPEFCQRDDADLSLENLKDRLSWYSARHDLQNCPDNATTSLMSKEAEGEALPSNRSLLWTDLYQPRSSKEVCGNTTAVEGLNTWLYDWQLKITGQAIRGEEVNKGVKRDRSADYDSDEGWVVGDSDNDSDAGDDDDTGLHNTLLVTGPEGCGKSAAVYACAGEQGFTVIEVNASDCRNGALIKQKFGEAMESHGLGKGSQVGVESPQPASKKIVSTQENSPVQTKQDGTKQRRLFAEKRAVDKSPIKAQQERVVASPDENQLDTHSKRKTVILFEDVDKHFDEDKGFLTTLVQLSKITKRPIILTSNRCEPGLPPALEKCRVDFGYPTSEELVLHACLVSIAEGVPCSPWLLERFVDSCHDDLRKVMMALQFWGQGKAPLQLPSSLSRPAGFVKMDTDVELHQLDTHGTSGKLSIEQEKTLSLNRTSELSLCPKQGKGPFDQWKSDARWLFELDVHHFILPKIIGGSFVCPLTLLVGEKVSTAVKELQEYAEYIAASQSEERARVKHSEDESKELKKKASRKEKDALRRAFQSGSRVPDDRVVIDLTPDEDAHPDNHCGESWACSPLKSLREAKTVARSPLKSKVLKSRRALVICDSDDEEQIPHSQPETSFESVNHTIPNVETCSPGIPIIVAHPQPSTVDLVGENLEDTDVIISSISESLTKVRRKRLSKKNSSLETGVPKLKSLADITGEEVPDLKVEPLGIQTNEIVSNSQLVGPISEESDRPFLVVDENDRLTTELNTSISGDCKTSGNPEMERQLSAQHFDYSGEDQIQSIFSSGGEQILENSSMDTKGLQQPAFKEESNHVNDSGLMANSGLQSPPREILDHTKDALPEPEVIGQPGDSATGLLGPVLEFPESAKLSVDDVNLSTGLDAQEEAAEGSISPRFEPVADAWASVRKSQQTSESLLYHSETSADVASSLAELLDIISASDVISFVEPEEYKDAWRHFDGTYSEPFEGNIGHSSDWEGCQEIASQLVCKGLQQSLPFLPAINHRDYRLPVLSCILECAMDSPAVGKCMITHAGLTRGNPHQSSTLHGMVANLSAKMSPIRHAVRQGRLDDVVQAAVPPRGRVSRSAMVEYSAYLSRMSQLEEIRRTNVSIQGRRPRRFEHRLTSKLKSLSDSDITELLKYSTFRSS